MGEFFKGWKRKSGVLTLVMACVFTGGWIRSVGYCEQHTLPWGNRLLLHVGGENGFFFCCRTVTSPPKSSPRLSSWHFREPSADTPDKNETYAWSSPLLILQTGVAEAGSVKNEMVVVPYWSLVFPLILLSAGLLLSKPRLAKPPQAT